MAKGRARGKQSTVILGEDDHGSLHALNEEVVVLKKKGEWAKILKIVSWALLGLFGVTLTVYTALGATLMAAMPEDDQQMTWVQRSTFVGGRPAPGQFIYVSMSSPADDSVWGHLKQTYLGIDDPAVLVSIAGPYGVVENNEGGVIIFEGEDTGFIAPLAESPKKLSGEYSALCVSGNCEPGKVYTVPQENIAGEARYHIDLTERSVTPFEEE